MYGDEGIYILESHATQLKLIAGFQYDYHESEEHTFYKAVNGERVAITEKEYRAIAKQYSSAPMKLKCIPIEQ